MSKIGSGFESSRIASLHRSFIVGAGARIAVIAGTGIGACIVSAAVPLEVARSIVVRLMARFHEKSDLAIVLELWRRVTSRPRQPMAFRFAESKAALKAER